MTITSIYPLESGRLYTFSELRAAEATLPAERRADQARRRRRTLTARAAGSRRKGLAPLLQIGARDVIKLLTMEAPPRVGGPTLALRRPSPCGNLGIRRKHRSLFGF